MNRIVIRLAVPGEAPALTALCVRSKAHWGYDAAFMALSAASLSVSEDDIAAGRVLVAVDASDAIPGRSLPFYEYDLFPKDPP